MTAGHTTDNHPLMHSSFRWSVPTHFNIAQVCSRRWAASPAHASGTAVLRHQTEAGEGRAYSYVQLQTAADALSHVLASQGVKPGDRVAVVLPQ
ncbi:MAG: AMP-binding protein, partial [Burkholderiales bacterium]|nr:AMP-binding protein [Burkholderiales bacterium]